MDYGEIGRLLPPATALRTQAVTASLFFSLSLPISASRMRLHLNLATKGPKEGDYLTRYCRVWMTVRMVKGSMADL